MVTLKEYLAFLLSISPLFIVIAGLLYILASTVRCQ